MLAVLVDRLGLQMDEAMVTQLSSSTPGYVASDLALLMTRVARHDELSMDKVKEELVNARPAAIKTGLGSISHDKVGLDSIGGMQEVKGKLMRATHLPLTSPQSFTKLGILPSKCVLMSGPPGCGKTRLVRVVASTCQATFLGQAGSSHHPLH